MDELIAAAQAVVVYFAEGEPDPIERARRVLALNLALVAIGHPCPEA